MKTIVKILVVILPIYSLYQRGMEAWALWRTQMVAKMAPTPPENFSETKEFAGQAIETWQDIAFQPSFFVPQLLIFGCLIALAIRWFKKGNSVWI